jgi:RNA polymerase sigma-70 factor (ECF subfamily)
VYEDSYGAIHAYAARRVGAAAADEIVAETFLVAWRRVEEVPREPLPWLIGVARNVVMRHRTASARQQHAVDALARERTVGQQRPGREENARLWEAWERLRPVDRARPWVTPPSQQPSPRPWTASTNCCSR